jgi:hypothetical protein
MPGPLRQSTHFIRTKMQLELPFRIREHRHDRAVMSRLISRNVAKQRFSGRHRHVMRGFISA